MKDRVLGSGSRVPGRQTALLTILGAALFGPMLWFNSVGCSGQRATGKDAVPTRTAMERNADCCMCHQPFLTEPLSVRHARHDVTCADCHGASRAHSTDEKFQIPPDVVVKPNGVDPFCLRCHKEHEMKKPPRNSLAATDPKALGTEAPHRCTSCHGRHRIARVTTRP